MNLDYCWMMFRGSSLLESWPLWWENLVLERYGLFLKRFHVHIPDFDFFFVSKDHSIECSCWACWNRYHHRGPLFQWSSFACWFSGSNRLLPADGHSRASYYCTRGFSFLCATSATGVGTYVGKGCLVSVSEDSHHRHIDSYFFSAEKCLTICGLDAFADAMVGSLGVEQRKRTTIGVELAAKASVSFICRDPVVNNFLYSHSCSFFWMSQHQVLIHKALGLSWHFCAALQIMDNQFCARKCQTIL